MIFRDIYTNLSFYYKSNSYRSFLFKNLFESFYSNKNFLKFDLQYSSLSLIVGIEYKELLELSLICLGKMPQEKISFKRPGAVHHAKWMAKAIYSSKMFLFRNEFKLSNEELHGLRQF